MEKKKLKIKMKGPVNNDKYPTVSISEFPTLSKWVLRNHLEFTPQDADDWVRRYWMSTDGMAYAEAPRQEPDEQRSSEANRSNRRNSAEDTER